MTFCGAKPLLDIKVKFSSHDLPGVSAKGLGKLFINLALSTSGSISVMTNSARGLIVDSPIRPRCPQLTVIVDPYAFSGASVTATSRKIVYL